MPPHAVGGGELIPSIRLRSGGGGRGAGASAAGAVMVFISCYNCGSDRRSPFAEENGFHLMKCRDCGLLYVCPRPDDATLLSAHTYGAHGGEDAPVFTTGRFDESKLGAYQRMLEDLYGHDFESARDKLWLDVGCGHGEFLVALRAFSRGRLRLRGLEPNIRKQESAASRGLDVSNFDLQAASAEYDGISLLNVFAHLPNPPVFLRQVRAALKSGGELLIETGDTADLSPEEHYRPFYLPDHLSFASEKIVRGILERAGFRVAAVRKYAAFPFSETRAELLKEFVRWAVRRGASDFPALCAAYRRSRRYVTDMYLRAAAC